MPTLVGMRMLVVEDDPGMTALLVRSLQREGYAVDSVANGEDALWSVLEIDYDAVVLDAMIPPPDGFEVCRRMRAEGRWAPVLMLTARDAVPDRIRGLDAGADTTSPSRSPWPSCSRGSGRSPAATRWNVRWSCGLET
jgi:two-component system, OmpR family, response regulator